MSKHVPVFAPMSTRLLGCSCGFRCTSQNPDDEVTAHMAAVLGARSTVGLGLAHYYVTRVLLHEGRTVQLQLLPPGVASSIQAEVDAGAYALLPDGSICEPIELYLDEPQAHERRTALAAQHPAEDFRVLMTVELSV